MSTGKRKPLFVSRWKRVRLIALFALAIIAYYLIPYLFMDVVQPFWYWCRASSIIDMYEKAPSDALANKMFYILDRRLASQPLGNRALKLLLTPRLDVRSQYGIGTDPVARLVWRHQFDGAWCDFGTRYSDNFLQGYYEMSNPNLSAIYFIHEPSKGGTYTPRLQYEVSTKLSKIPEYASAVSEYFEIDTPLSYDFAAARFCYGFVGSVSAATVFVPKEQLSAIPRISSATIDEIVPELFKIDDDRGLGNNLPELVLDAEPYDDAVQLTLCWEEPPVPLAFCCDIWIPELNQYIGNRQEVLVIPGLYSRNTWINITAKSFPPAGEYPAELHLIASEELAQTDPAFAEIWDGTVTLPFTLRVPNLDGERRQ